MPNATYLELLPKEALTHLIKCFWISSNDSGQELSFTTLPDGCIELIVFFQRGQLTNVRVFDILSEGYDMVMPDGEVKLGIRLKPLGKEYYIDTCTTLDRFGKVLYGPLSDMLQRFAELVTADMEKVPQEIDNRKLLLFDLLHQRTGNIDVKTLSEQCFWSSRQMNRYFTSQFGISLKSYSNILKCYASYQDIKAGQLHPDQGFYDQSHFIREIRRHTGTTPKMLLKNEAQRYLQLNDRVVIAQ